MNQILKCNIRAFPEQETLKNSGLAEYQEPFALRVADGDPEKYKKFLHDANLITINKHPEYDTEHQFTDGGIGFTYLVKEKETGKRKIYKLLSYNNDEHNIPSKDSELALLETRVYAGSRNTLDADETKNVDDNSEDISNKIGARELLTIADQANTVTHNPEELIKAGFLYKTDSIGQKTKEVKSAFAQILTDYVDGPNFNEWAKEYDFAPHLIVMYKLLLAIETIHSQKLIYRDLKPDNVKIENDQNPKLYDFSLLTKVENDTDNSTSFFSVDSEGDMSASFQWFDFKAQEKAESYSQSSDLYTWMLMFMYGINPDRFNRVNYCQQLVGLRLNERQLYNFIRNGGDKYLVNNFSEIVNNLALDAVPLSKKLLVDMADSFKQMLNDDFTKRPTAHELRIKLENLMRSIGLDVPKLNTDNLDLKDARKIVTDNFNEINKSLSTEKAIKPLYDLMNANAEQLFHCLDMQLYRPAIAKNKYDLLQCYKKEKSFEKFTEGLVNYPADKQKASIYAKQHTMKEAKILRDNVTRNLKSMFKSHDKDFKEYGAYVDLLHGFTELKQLSSQLNSSTSAEILKSYVPELIDGSRYALEKLGWNQKLLDLLESPQGAKFNPPAIANVIKKNIKILKSLNLILEADKLCYFDKHRDKLKRYLDGKEDINARIKATQEFIEQQRGPAMIQEYRTANNELAKILIKNQALPSKIGALYKKLYGEKKDIVKDGGFSHEWHEWLIKKYQSKSKSTYIYDDLERMKPKDSSKSVSEEAIQRSIKLNLSLLKAMLNDLKKNFSI